MSGLATSLADRIAAGSHQGDREYQEDSFLVVDLRDSGIDDAVLMLLSDGMGGHFGGDVASDLAVTHFAESFIERQVAGGGLEQSFMVALDAATNSISEKVAAQPELEGMGCTLVGVLVRENRAYWLSVGDSPFWLYRNGTLARLNADHSMKPVLAKMVEAGELTEEEAERDGSGNALRSAVGAEPPELVDMNVSGYLLQSEDVLVVASDGVETLSDGEIGEFIDKAARKPVQNGLDTLLDGVLAKREPGQDNVTAILMRPLLSEEGLEAKSQPTRKVVAVAPADEFEDEARSAPTRPPAASAPSGKPRRNALLFGAALAAAIFTALAAWVKFANDGTKNPVSPQTEVTAPETSPGEPPAPAGANEQSTEELDLQEQEASPEDVSHPIDIEIEPMADRHEQADPAETPEG